jgi:predicted transcriptional regulator
MAKTPNRHVDPKMVVYPLRIEESHLDQCGKIAKKEDRTRASVIRGAIRKYLESKEAS